MMRPSGLSLPRLSTRLMVAFALAGALPWALFARDAIFSRDWISGDFVAFFAAAKLVATGTGSQIYQLGPIAAAERAAAGHDVGGTGILPYFNPPFFAWLLRPFTAFSLQGAYRVWSVFSLAWLALDAWLLWRIAAPMPREWRRVVVVGFIASFPVAFGLHQGQYSLILEGSWSAAYLLLRARRTGLAGMALAPMLIKPELLLPVAMLLVWKREWRAVGTLAGCAAVAVAVSVAVVGASSAAAYPGYLIDSMSWSIYGNTPSLMFGWNGLVAASIPLASGARQVATIVLSLATLGCAGWLWRSSAFGRGRSFAERWLALSLATMLVDQHFYFQDIVILVPGVVAVLATARERDRKWIAGAVGVAWCAQLLATYPNEFWHVNLIATLAALTFGALVVRDLRRTHRLRIRQDVVRRSVALKEGSLQQIDTQELQVFGLVSIGSAGSGAHSESDASYTATSE